MTAMGELVLPPSLSDCLRVLDAHKQQRLARMPVAVKKWRRDYYYLCPECGGEMRRREPLLLNGPAVDTRDGTIKDNGPLHLVWPCSRGCQSLEADPEAQNDPAS